MKYNIMKKLIFSTLLSACSVFAAIAQSPADNSSSKLMFGAFGGLNIPKLTGGGGNPLSEGWSSREGMAFGLTVEWNANPHFAWCANVLYSGEGGQHNGMQALKATSFNPQLPAGTYFYADFKNESILNYLEIPVMAKYSCPIFKSSRVFLEFGPYAGILLKANQKTKGSSIVYADQNGTIPVSVDPNTGQVFTVSFDANTDIKNQIHKGNFGMTAGLGYAHNLGIGDIILNVRGAYGLTNIQKYS
jgi:hypothetical protein